MKMTFVNFAVTVWGWTNKNLEDFVDIATTRCQRMISQVSKRKGRDVAPIFPLKIYARNSGDIILVIGKEGGNSKDSRILWE
jgi:hypothetical protein